MFYGNIKEYDIANGPGVRVSLFVSGCRRHCKNCFNKETWNFMYGQPYTDEVKEKILTILGAPYIRGLTVLGGEPFEPENQEQVYKLIKAAKERYPEKDVWIFSGNTLEEITTLNHLHTSFTDRILSLVDVLVDGEFIEEKKNISLRFRGSENQRLIDMKKTFETQEIVLWNE